MNYITLFFITAILAITSILTLVLVKPELKTRCNKKYPLYICDFIIIAGISLYVGFLFNLSTGTHINSSYVYEEFPINRLTTDSVSFGHKNYALHNSYTVIEEPTEEYDNVVVVETETYQIQWLCKYNVTGTTYHVYLTEDIYNKYQNSFFDVIYERME